LLAVSITKKWFDRRIKPSVTTQVRSWPYRQSSLLLSFKFDLAFWLDKIAFKFKRLVFALKDGLV